MALTNKLQSIGDAIRNKTGKTELLTLDEMPVEINNITTGEPIAIPYAPQCISFYDFNGDNLDYELANLDTSNMTSIKRMFARESSNDYKLKRIDISHFNMSNVTDMTGMFYGRSGLKDVIGLDTIDTSKVTKMSSIFYQAGVDAKYYSNLNTSNVMYLDSAFASFYGEIIDISNWDLSKVTSLSSFAVRAYSKEIYFGNTTLSNTTSATYMFAFNTTVTTIDLGGVYAPKMDALRDSFTGDTNLTDLIFLNEYGKGFTKIKQNNYSNACFSLADCNKLTYESLMDVINKLYDLNLTYDVANGGTLYTQKLTLGSTNLAKLTAEEIAIATNKGWTVS